MSYRRHVGLSPIRVFIKKRTTVSKYSGQTQAILASIFIPIITSDDTLALHRGAQLDFVSGTIDNFVLFNVEKLPGFQNLHISTT